jgi:hypothetical protein
VLQRRPFPKERTRVIIDSGRPFLTSADWLGPVHLRWGLCAGPPLILAENMPANTFVDNIDRPGSDNWAEHEEAGPRIWLQGIAGKERKRVSNRTTFD